MQSENRKHRTFPTENTAEAPCTANTREDHIRRDEAVRPEICTDILKGKNIRAQIPTIAGGLFCSIRRTAFPHRIQRLQKAREKANNPPPQIFRCPFPKDRSGWQCQQDTNHHQSDIIPRAPLIRSERIRDIVDGLRIVWIQYLSIFLLISFVNSPFRSRISKRFVPLRSGNCAEKSPDSVTGASCPLIST